VLRVPRYAPLTAGSDDRGAAQKFDAAGNLTDERIGKSIQDLLARWPLDAEAEVGRTSALIQLELCAGLAVRDPKDESTGRSTSCQAFSAGQLAATPAGKSS